MKHFTSQNQKVGKVGEDLAEKYLKKKGFSIMERNYTKKWGEIDLVTKKGSRFHFIEVKTVTWSENMLVRPEENAHEAKLRRMYRACETYFMDRHVSYETPWQADLVTVILDTNKKTARINYFPSI